MTDGMTRLHHVRLRRPLRNLHRCHQLVWDAAGERCLWAQPLRTMLLVLHDGPLDPPRREVVSVSEHEYRLDYEPGARVGFSLIATPTRMSHMTGKRHPLPPEEREGWLRRKLHGALSVDALAIDQLGPRVAVKRGRPPMTHVWVQFSGAGVVVNPAALRDLLVTGVGGGKAHGAGLLLVGPR